jgi:gluconolactonase
MNDNTFCSLTPDGVFRDIVGDSPGVRLLRGGFRFLEGPVWYPPAGGLVFSDIPADTMYLWRSEGTCAIFRRPSFHANGNILDARGRLVTCEQGGALVDGRLERSEGGGRRLVRLEADGSLTVLAERFAGRRLNSPNDVAARRDGTLWFTDPPYGILPEEQEQSGRFVFRLTPAGELTAVLTDFIKPNGIALSPDERVLYVSDTADERHHIRCFPLGSDGLPLNDGTLFRVIHPGKSDGFCLDEAGRLYTSAGEGVWVLDTRGALLGKIFVPETPSNCAFGGSAGRTLYITARTGLYAVDLAVRGHTPVAGLWA